MGSGLCSGPFRVPYYIVDLKGDPNLENYPYGTTEFDKPLVKPPVMKICKNPHITPKRKTR